LHLASAEWLLSAAHPDLADVLAAGWHLLSGGEEGRGSEVLHRVALELLEADQLPEAIPLLEAAVAIYRKANRPRHEICGLTQHLAAAGYYAERRLADQYGDDALELLAEETGLALARRSRPYVGSYIALVIGLVYAVILHLFGRRGGVRALNANVSVMGGLCAALGGVSVICLDSAGAARRAAHFEPFEPLGLWHPGAFCHALAKTLVGVTEDRPSETMNALSALLHRFDKPGGVIAFPVDLKPLTRSGILYALGALQGFMDAPLSLACADELEECGLRLYDMLACQLRANYYAYQGNVELSKEFDQRVELHATRSGSTWQAEVWTPSSRIVACKRTYDLIGLKRSSEELERLAVEIPSLERYARGARAVLSLMRGEYEAAIPPLEALHTETAPRAFIGWTEFTAALGEAYNETGQSERAATVCGKVVAEMPQGDRLVASLMLDVELELSIADARCGRGAAAEHRLGELLALHTPNQGAVTLGRIHRAWAEVARAAVDEDLARYHRTRMEYWFRSTKNPSLIAECDRYRLPSDRPRAAAAMVALDTATVQEPMLIPGFEEETTESATAIIESIAEPSEPRRA
jgi:hypothetical protein